MRLPFFMRARKESENDKVLKSRASKAEQSRTKQGGRDRVSGMKSTVTQASRRRFNAALCRAVAPPVCAVTPS